MRCVIIAGSPATNPDFLRQTVTHDDYVICADKGYAYARLAGIAPDLIVGDFDSLKENIDCDCEKVTLNPRKDDTDTNHSISLALERGYRDFIILGALGGRLDHTFGNFAMLLFIANQGGRGVLLSESEHIEILTAGEYCFNGCKSKTFSLFPFGCDSVCVSYSGAEYPLDRYRVKSDVTLGVSNVFSSDCGKIKIYDGNAILIINMKEEYI